MESDYFKPLSPDPTSEELALHEKLCDPKLVTERLGQLVPLLKFVGFQVEQMEQHKTVLTVPLLETAMNQNGTHQAAVFYLLADYTLGVGMFAALPGCYTVGVHDRCRALPVQFWLRSGQVQHRQPGTGVIRGEVGIAPIDARTMRDAMVAKGRCELVHDVKIYQDDQLVAVTEHRMGLYADVPRMTGVRASLTQVHNVKTSALMIAGLRDDDVSKGLAQDQGVAIARRMTRNSPQLPTMVEARTNHLRDIAARPRSKIEQVLALGVGLDPKPLELSSNEQAWYLCDLPDMLKERNKRLASIGRKAVNSIDVPVDLRLPNWPEKILATGFDPTKPTLVILEGVSMYLTELELMKSLGQIRDLCQNPESQLWFDHVTEELLDMDVPEVKAFMSSMARLGEPFVTGFRDPTELCKESWRVLEHPTASDIMKIDDEIHREYRFALMQVVS